MRRNNLIKNSLVVMSFALESKQKLAWIILQLETYEVEVYLA